MEKQRGWHPPAPGLGSKRRDAALVAERLAVWAPKLIVLPFAGLAGELSRCASGVRLVVADSDPAVRAVWKIANDGRLAEACAIARERWRVLVLRRAPGADAPLARLDKPRLVKTPEQARVWAAWNRLREMEPRFVQEGGDDPTGIEYAAWSVAVFAGAIGGRRRRNGDGRVNIPYGPSYAEGWLPERIAPDEKMRAADAWARGRVVDVLPDWHDSFDRVTMYASPSNLHAPRLSAIAFLIDPPYGREAGSVYDATWDAAARDALVARTREVVAAGARAIVWCGEQDIDAWCPLVSGHESFSAAEGRAVARWDDQFEFTWRATNVHMKSGGVRKVGVEPDRKARGGWIGISR